MIRIGLLGCAHVHAAAYAGELAEGETGGELVAVFDPDAARAVAFADRFSLATAGDPDALCRSVDAVVVTAEHRHYVELVGAAAAAGVPVLCEKPLGTTPEEARALLASGAWLSVAFAVRYAEPVQRARAAIAGGDLGRLLAMSGVNHAAYPGGFFGVRALSGGGAILDHTVHLADALRYLTGCEFSTVLAESGRFFEVGDAEDCAQLVATTTDGAWASIDSSWSRPQGMPGANDFEMTMWFERGEVRLDGFARHAIRFSSGGVVELVGYGRSMNAQMLADFVRAVATGGEPPVAAADGAAATAVAFAAMRSAESGAVEAVESFTA